MKKRVIKDYKKLPNEIKKAINLKYPWGIEGELKAIKGIGNLASFQGFMFEHGDVVYLIKYSDETKSIPVNVVLSQSKADIEDEDFTNDSDIPNKEDEWYGEDY